jgi:hypothetical protein
VHDRLIALLGGGAPRAAALLPARSAQLALALYCDGGRGGELGDLRELQILVAEAPGAFQRLSAPSARR